ncbi:metallo-beta-lactamase [Aurantivibrio plasticivorans]
MNFQLNKRCVLAVTSVVAALMCSLPSASSTDNEAARYVSDLSNQEKKEMAKPLHQDASEPEEPFNVLANIYSVGAKNIGVYLITTDQGHILIDSGTREMQSLVIDNIKRLGFKPSDIHILLATHAHFDHVQAHSAIQNETKAKVFAMEGDAQALRQGKDLSPLGFEGWPKVKVDRVLKHGDVVSLGGVNLTATQVPGHTPGCTVWSLTASESDRQYDVAVFGCRGPNAGVQLQGNPQFPDLIQETLLGFDRLAELSPDIYISNHPGADIARWGDALKVGARPHPLLEQQPWDEMVAKTKAQFMTRYE